MPFPAPTLVRPKDFGGEDYNDLCDYIIEKARHYDKRLSSFRNDKLVELVRLYKGKPKNKEVDWPWPGASNLVVQLIGTYADELLSRVMGIYMYDPLWTVDIGGDNREQVAEEEKQVLESFMMDMAYDHDELDLYRVEIGRAHV